MTELTDEQVVDLYMSAYLTGSSLKAAAEAHNVSPQYLNWRAAQLRHAGVKLPRKYTKITTDVEGLNRRIEQSKGEDRE